MMNSISSGYCSRLISTDSPSSPCVCVCVSQEEVGRGCILHSYCTGIFFEAYMENQYPGMEVGVHRVLLAIICKKKKKFLWA